MKKQMDRRQFLKLDGPGGVVFVSGLVGWRTGQATCHRLRVG
jgi:hypothetical protein